MAKKTSSPSRRKRKPFQDAQSGDATIQTPVGNAATPAGASGEGARWSLIALFVVIALGGTYLMKAAKSWTHVVPRFTYKVVNEYPHDPGAFTQGLVMEDGVVFESTGKLNGQSSIRTYKLGAETVEKIKPMGLDEFGEGLAMVGDKLYQITWKNEVCYVYDKELNKVKQFAYQGHGWGLAYDGTHLIMSDGTARLHFIDPETFEDVRVVTVRNGQRPVNNLNELEYSGGSIYANRLNVDRIYEINPATGQVESIIDLSGLWEDRPAEGVLNGIAVDSNNGKLIVTGKYCPKLFEIELVPQGE